MNKKEITSNYELIITLEVFKALCDFYQNKFPPTGNNREEWNDWILREAIRLTQKLINKNK